MRTLRQRTPPLRSSRCLKGMIVSPAQWMTRQRRPNGKPPINSDSEEETVKKPNWDESSGKTTTSSPTSTPPDKSYKFFINAMKSSGWERSKLMNVIPGVCYYCCRGLYLQHSHSDHSKDKARSTKSGDRDSDNWKAFKGTIQQDAFARLLQEYKDLRARYHIFPNA